MVKLDIKQNTYYDSVTLMLISKDLKKLDGVEEALVGMGTDLNRDIAHNLGLVTPEFETITANDFFVAIRCENDDVMSAALAKVDELLTKKKENSSANYYPPTLSSAIKMDDQLNLAIISVPGKYAAGVADECLDHDINVMLFSDNVTIEEEKRLKEKAVSKELLMMGPDCGTAIINNVPLAFANVIRPGDIGIVGASGTGTQELSSLIGQFGGGVSQVIGTGGRDLKIEIGGLMMTFALDALIQDPKTKVIALTSKPPAEEIADKILKQAAASGKPVVVCFVGGDPEQVKKYGLIPALSLEDAARKAVALSKGEPVVDFTGFSAPDAEIDAIVKAETAKFAPTQKYVRGLYTGGTLCDEAMKMLTKAFGGVYSNIPLKPEFKLEDVNVGVENTCLDYGDDDFPRPPASDDRPVPARRARGQGVARPDGRRHPRGLCHRLRLPSQPGRGPCRRHPHRQGERREGRPLPERHHLRLRHRGGPAVPLQDAAAAARRGRGRDAHQLAGDPPC